MLDRLTPIVVDAPDAYWIRLNDLHMYRQRKSTQTASESPMRSHEEVILKLCRALQAERERTIRECADRVQEMSRNYHGEEMRALIDARNLLLALLPS